MGLKVDYVESGSIADMEDYFTEGDGILEIDQIQLNQGTFRYICLASITRILKRIPIELLEVLIRTLN